MIPFTLDHHPSNDGRICQLPNLLPELWKYSGNSLASHIQEGSPGGGRYACYVPDVLQDAVLMGERS